jgi:hypothetical protein
VRFSQERCQTYANDWRPPVRTGDRNSIDSIEWKRLFLREELAARFFFVRHFLSKPIGSAEDRARVPQSSSSTTRAAHVQLLRNSQRDLTIVLQEVKQRVTRDEIRLAGLDHLCRGFVRAIGNGRVQPENIPSPRNPGDDGLTFTRASGKLHSTGAEDENSARLLDLDELNC